MAEGGSLGVSFWRTHAWVPLLLFIGLAALFEFSLLDLEIARAWAYDASRTPPWIGQDTRWADAVLHDAGRRLIIVIVATLLVAWLLSFRLTGLARHRAASGYAGLAMLLCWGTVGLLKQVTNIDCAWSVQGFGGSVPFLSLLDARPPQFPRGACFPGAHSASAFALFAFYFALRDRSPRAARAALGTALVLGSLFSFAQQARGAHFISHDVWSAAIAWTICLALYARARPGLIPPASAQRYRPVPNR